MRLIASAGIAVTLAAAVACGGSSSPSSMGTLSVMLKDSPYSDAKSLLVTFSDVSAHRDDQADETGTKIPFASGATSRTCDLKKLQTAQDVLGVGTLPAGHYTWVKVTVTAATLYFENAATGAACADSIQAPQGANASVDVPSGVVKLNREFTVQAGGSTTMLLDFDGDQSVHQTGNGRYMMSPVIAIAGVS